jgi:hypothetical protein
MKSLEQKIYDAIEGHDFIEAGTTLTIVLGDIALRKANGNRDFVRALFLDIANSVTDAEEEEWLH